VRGLIRLYQSLVVAVTLVGFAFYFGVFRYFASPDMLSTLGVTGVGALLPPDGIEWLYTALLLLATASYLGLFFFTWWSRPLYIGTFAVGMVMNLGTGVQVSLPVDSLFGGAMWLMHGAIMTLSFLPPISSYFARERQN
jgi:hypothetical protein